MGSESPGTCMGRMSSSFRKGELVEGGGRWGRKACLGASTVSVIFSFLKMLCSRYIKMFTVVKAGRYENMYIGTYIIFFCMFEIFYN